MKNILLIVLLLSFFSCKSSKEAQRDVEINTAAEIVEVKDTDVEETKEIKQTESTESNISETKESETSTWWEKTIFSPDEKVQSFERGGSASKELETKTAQINTLLEIVENQEISIKLRDSIISMQNERIKFLESEEKKTDTRPVQGIEWLWIIIGIILVVGLIYLYTTRKMIV